MAATLTRKALYELVWSKPRTTLAKEMGVSDVWIGKQCREMNVPAPPPGYWANLAAGGKRKANYVRPTLTYTVVERIQEDHAAIAAALSNFSAEDFSQPVPAEPAFAESADETVARYMQFAREVPPSGTRRGVHPIVQKLMAEDDRLAALARQYSWEQPKYRSPEGKRLLDVLNQIQWRWTELGFKPTSSGTRHIRMRVACEGYSRSFELRSAEPAAGERRRGPKMPDGGIQLWFDIDTWERPTRKQPALSFAAMDRSVLEAVMEITISHWETGFRESMRWRHQRHVEARACALTRVEEARERERQRQAAEQRALLSKRHRLLHEALRGLDRSDQIRGLVQAIELRVGQPGVDGEAFALWKSWALAQADALDPREATAERLREWFGLFRLDDGAAS